MACASASWGGPPNNGSFWSLEKAKNKFPLPGLIIPSNIFHCSMFSNEADGISKKLKSELLQEIGTTLRNEANKDNVTVLGGCRIIERSRASVCANSLEADGRLSLDCESR